MSGGGAQNQHNLNTSSGGGNHVDNDDTDFMGDFDYGNAGFQQQTIPANNVNRDILAQQMQMQPQNQNQVTMKA